LPLFFSNTKILLVSINAILVGDSNPAATTSAFRVLSLNLGSAYTLLFVSSITIAINKKVQKNDCTS
jgi:hypothetical protein